jgi:hypothetical protein
MLRTLDFIFNGTGSPQKSFRQGRWSNLHLLKIISLTSDGEIIGVDLGRPGRRVLQKSKWEMRDKDCGAGEGEKGTDCRCVWIGLMGLGDWLAWIVSGREVSRQMPRVLVEVISRQQFHYSDWTCCKKAKSNNW